MTWCVTRRYAGHLRRNRLARKTAADRAGRRVPLRARYNGRVAPRDPETPEELAHAPTVESTPDDDLGSAASLLRGIASAPGRPLGLGGPLRVDQVVAGKYQIARAIGEGGMGLVYRARDLRLARDVAIKVGSAVSSSGLARLEHEAQALARLAHPNVVVVYEVGEVDGRVYVAMELVTGGTARTWSRSEPRTTGEIVAAVRRRRRRARRGARSGDRAP